MPPVSNQISRNVRFLLWRKKVDPTKWAGWLARRTSLDGRLVVALVDGSAADARVDEQVLAGLAVGLDYEDEPDTLRNVDLVGDSGQVLRENLKFLFESLGHGGKRALAARMGIDPTTVSRWLSGTYAPPSSKLRHLAESLGLPPETDLAREPLFLSIEPIAAPARRRWIKERVDLLPADELRDLFPAFRRLLGER